MNEFDLKASGWDADPVHIARSEAIAQEMLRYIPLTMSMKALEFGSGTGILSFLLKDRVKEIVLMDSSSEMLAVTKKKIDSSGVRNLKILNFDLENGSYDNGSFDLIFTQMVLHHVKNIGAILVKFSALLNPGGYLAIADLYPEDGSFHGEGFTGYKGFDPDMIGKQLEKLDFSVETVRECFMIKRKSTDGTILSYPVFLLIATKKSNL